jgi:hypothetical protein
MAGQAASYTLQNALTPLYQETSFILALTNQTAAQI